MTKRCFYVLLAAYGVVFCILALVVWFTTDECPLHYAVDTMTLRGRIPDPPTKWPILFKLSEDIASLLVFIILGFGLSFYTECIEARFVKAEYRATVPVLEETGVLETPKPKRPVGRQISWKEWLREKHPEMYERYYEPEPQKKTRLGSFRQWLMEMEKPD